MKNEGLKIKELRKIFKLYPEIKLVYLFGSRAKKDTGPLSDYDFAIYVETKDAKKRGELQLELIAELSRFLKTDKIDLVMLNLTESPELKYNIIKDGKLIFEKEPYRVLVEPTILNEYFDFRMCLLKYNLTK